MGPTMSTGIILLVTLFALLGGLAAAMLVWLNQKPRPPFDVGSFAASFIISLAAAFGIAETFNYLAITNTALACFAAFLSGMGGNTLIGGVAGAVLNRPTAEPVPGIAGQATFTSSKKGRFIPDWFYRRI